MKQLFSKNIELLIISKFGMVLAICLIIAISVLWHLDKWNSETFDVIKKVNMETEYTNVMRYSVKLREIAIQHMLNSNDVFDRDEERLKYLSYGSDFVKARKKLMAIETTVDMHELHKRITDAINYSQPFHQRLIELLMQKKASTQELRSIVKEGAKAQKQVVMLVDQLVRLQSERYQSVINNHEQAIEKVGVISITIYIVSLIIALVIVRFTTSRYKYVSRLSIIDEVTNTYNRRYFDMVMEEEWKRSMREYTPISVVMIDIDNFKAYNDKYGHQMGDTCLYSVAKIMGSQLRRSSDFIARYGGEEFIVVMPNTNTENARIMAERLRRSVEEGRIEASDTNVAPWVTVSVGVVTTTAEYEQSSSIIITAADQALYQSKNNGRNRVTEVNLSSVG